jgi:hypothetical protein
MSTYRATARAVGVVYLAGMVIGIGGNVLVQSILGAPDRLAAVSGNDIKLAIGGLLWLVPVAGDVAHGILMFPILKQQDERIATGYLGTRIVDAVFIAVQALFILLQIPLAREYATASAANALPLQALSNVLTRGNLYAYQIGMLAVGLSGLMLCYTFYRAKLVPRLVAVWGLVGYAALLVGSSLEVLGFELHSIHALPGGLWELFIGVWLIAKGFSSPRNPRSSSIDATL